MHLLKGAPRGLDNSAEPVDLQQSPGDIVILSAADTEISGLAAARRALGEPFPQLRLANWAQLQHPYSVDLYGEQVLAHAKLVVVRLLGGASYWRYGLDEAVRLARANVTKIVVLSGDTAWDAALCAEGTVAEDAARKLWSYLVEGGSENLADALRFCAHLIGVGGEPATARPLPNAGYYSWRHPTPDPSPQGGGEAQAVHPPPTWGRAGEGAAPPTAAIVFYRALVQAGQTEPVDALCSALAARGLAPLPLFVSSPKARDDAAFITETFAANPPAIVLNATAFALSQPDRSFTGTVLDSGERPVFQVTFAGVSEEAWAASSRGLSPTDLSMNVVLPELDGRLITRAVSFKQAGALDLLTECRPVRYAPKPDRIDFVAELAARWTNLQTKANADKRVAIILSRYPNREGRIASAVGLDAPESVARLTGWLDEAGYDVAGAPEDGASLMAELLLPATLSQGERVAVEQPGEGVRRSGSSSDRLPPHPSPAGPPSPFGRRESLALSLAHYTRCFSRLPQSVQDAVQSRWGGPADDPSLRDGAFALSARRFGNLVVAVQPARGHSIDRKASYHDSTLVPPHGYLAFYVWLREAFGADALVHMGKHGSLEWLPGKALALSEECFPEAVLGPIPVIYPFILNDPGEGSQAKRRSAAVIIDHLMPAMARAESYGPAAELEQLIDEYAAALAGDPRRSKPLATHILDLAQAHGFDRDLGLDLKGDRDAVLARLDEHICDIKELQVRDGLHILGESPVGRRRSETLAALGRLPRGGGRPGDLSLHRALAQDLGLEFDPLAPDFAEPWGGPKPPALADLGAAAWRTEADTVERLEALALALIEGAPCPEEWPATRAVLEIVEAEIAPALDGSGEAERRAVLAALNGRFVPPGPSGAPTRGRADCLPTGRNFYSVDVRAVPTAAAWQLGRRSADLLAERYFQDEGEWPKAIALTVWGTSNMRTGGDDIAQALALIGARPVWDTASGRVTGVDVMPLSELKRPRIDVTLRISGFFRDAFPSQIALFHEAVLAVSERAEPEDANPIAARIREDAARLAAAGVEHSEARRAASFRVFGSKPGAYGAGLQVLIDEGLWADRKELAAAFLEWSAYAYGGGADGRSARDLLETRLRDTDAIVQNQDNREHDLLDSDDYYQFEGGLSSAVETLRGQAPHIFHNDHSRPERPVVRSLEEEIARVVRGRAANPKWIAGVMRHGYKGASEIAATVDYLFAFAATTDAVQSHHFEQLYSAYVADDAVRGFIAGSNPAALREIAARFCEAVDRGLWAPRRNSAYPQLAEMAGRKAAA